MMLRKQARAVFETKGKTSNHNFWSSNRHQPEKSPSTSVGARTVVWLGGGPLWSPVGKGGDNLTRNQQTPFSSSQPERLPGISKNGACPDKPNRVRYSSGGKPRIHVKITHRDKVLHISRAYLNDYTQFCFPVLA
jgi:hypothetical protein